MSKYKDGFLFSELIISSLISLIALSGLLILFPVAVQHHENRDLYSLLQLSHSLRSLCCTQSFPLWEMAPLYSFSENEISWEDPERNQISLKRENNLIILIRPEETKQFRFQSPPLFFPLIENGDLSGICLTGMLIPRKKMMCFRFSGIHG